VTTDLDAFREREKLHEEGALNEILRVGVASEEGAAGDYLGSRHRRGWRRGRR
jgi:hypothetical protein